MPTPIIPHPTLLADPPILPRIDAWLVARLAIVVLFFAAWLIVIAHAGLILAAEWRLAAILREANEFAQLPRVTSQQLNGVVRAEALQAGWLPSRVVLRHDDRPDTYQVALIEVDADQALPPWLQALAPRMSRPLRAVGDLPPSQADRPRGANTTNPLWGGGATSAPGDGPTGQAR